MEEQSNEVLNEAVADAPSSDAVNQVAQEETGARPQEETVQTQTSQLQDTSASDRPVETITDAQAEENLQDKKKKKGKKKDKKPANDVDGGADKIKKENKVGGYVNALFKYFNIITLLPFALLMYAIFFSSYIVDKGELFKSNLTWICVILGVGVAIMIAWFIVTFKKRRVCSFDAFLLMALMICASMIAQCIIFKNFASFDGISIATLVATVAVLALLTVRLIMFDPNVQRNHNDKSYKAKGKASMYFKVTFTKYAFFIAMLCVIGALLILIITKSNIFEDFEFVASKTEKVVTLLFAAVAAIMMVVGIFIRIVRGRANVIDCMPYMMFMVTIGGLIYFITRQTYMILYIAIGCAIVGAVWLALCVYTLLVSNYQRTQLAVEPAGADAVEGEPVSATATDETQSASDDSVVSAVDMAQSATGTNVVAQSIADTPTANTQSAESTDNASAGVAETQTTESQA